MTDLKVVLPKPKLAAAPSSAEIASDYIRTLVFTGVLRSGQKVPVDDIADALGISRQPVREALIELAHDGLVATDGRRGTFVAGFGPSTIRDHYELYGLLQGFAVRRVARDADPAVLAELGQIAADAAEQDDIAELTRLSIAFARVINRAAGNDRLKLLIRAMTRFAPGEYYLSNVPDALQRNRTAMSEQLHAVESGDPEAAAEACARGWERTGEEMIAHLVRTGVFAAETPSPIAPTPADPADHPDHPDHPERTANDRTTHRS
ncbi:MAG: GntR family transcriptional regulator [Actinomycetota bacterium]|nr:GntR family transcriptional regulator [Actinomycetota bacterium]